MLSTVLPWSSISQQPFREALNLNLNVNYLMISFSNYLMITHNRRKKTTGDVMIDLPLQ